MTTYSKPKPQLLRGRTKSLHQPRALQEMRRGAVIAEHDERQRLALRNMQPREIGDADRGEAARNKDVIDRLGAEARHAQEFLAACAVDVERKALAVPQRPGELWIDVERQHPRSAIDD